MIVPGSASALLLRSAAPTGYNVERSIRLNAPDSAYLSRTPASAGNRKTWTWAGWVKVAKQQAYPDQKGLFFAGTSSTNLFRIMFQDVTGQLRIDNDANGSNQTTLLTTQVFRDFSAWMHIVLAVDTNQATASNRFKLYVNGSQITAFSTATYQAQGTDTLVNSTSAHSIGVLINHSPPYYFDGYLADIHFIDGQALDPSSFTEVSATTGQLIPKQYTGSFGTNGFWLKFSDNSAATATTLGKDYSGNSNNWTPNNLSVTAGAGNDSLVDTPTSYGTDTGAGGEVRGNYCTWNPLSAGNTTLSNGNLSSVTINQAGACGTVQFPPSGKWFFDLTFSQVAGQYNHIGIIKSNPTVAMLATTANTDAVLYRGDGNIYRNTGSGYSVVQTVSSYTSGDVIGVAVNNDASMIQFYKNGSTVGTAISLTAATEYTPFIHHGGNSTSGGDANFGQRPFAYTAPSGFKALCDTNLPAPVLAKPNTAFDATLWTGLNINNARTISGLNFGPDLVWIKNRTVSYGHQLFDAVRGTTRGLSSNGTGAEFVNDIAGTLSAFNADGFTTSPVTNNSSFNDPAHAYVAWTWDAGSSTVTNTQGSITTSLRANPSAGFSVATWTGVDGTSTIGHGLNAAPAFWIIKPRSSANNWNVYHTSLGSSNLLFLNNTSAVFNSSMASSSVAPTSTVVTVKGNNDGWDNKNGVTYVGYFWTPVAGYSSFGRYTGNGSADGPFVFTGFRPRWLMVKQTNTARDWLLIDAARSDTNVADDLLLPNSSGAEFSNNADNRVDFLSNGFKLRGLDAGMNQSAGTYIYAAFAESPFQYARAP